MLGRRLYAATLVLSLGLAWASPSLALTDEERAAARAAAGQGADAYDAGKWSDAVELFSRAEALVHSPIHLLFIGRSEMQLGQWVKASETFNRIKRESLPADAPPALKRAVEDASTELAKLEPQLPSVAAKVKNPVGDVQVTMDGTVVPPLLVGLMRPVDPGQHQFQAKAAGLASEVVTIDVKPSTQQTVELLLKAGGAATPASAPVAPTPAAPSAPTADSGAGASSGGPSGMKIGGYAALGAGVVGLGIGTLFIVKAGSTQSDSNKLCPNSPCDPAQKPAIDSKDKDAASQRTIALIGFAAGGAAVAAGITLLVLPSGSSKAAHEPHLQPFIGYRTLGLSGRF